MSATATRDSYYCIPLGHLERCNTNRNDPTCVALPKVAKASTQSVPFTNVFTTKTLSLYTRLKRRNKRESCDCRILTTSSKQLEIKIWHTYC